MEHKYILLHSQANARQKVSKIVSCFCRISEFIYLEYFPLTHLERTNNWFFFHRFSKFIWNKNKTIVCSTKWSCWAMYPAWLTKSTRVFIYTIHRQFNFNWNIQFNIVMSVYTEVASGLHEKLICIHAFFWSTSHCPDSNWAYCFGILSIL